MDRRCIGTRQSRRVTEIDVRGGIGAAAFATGVAVSAVHCIGEPVGRKDLEHRLSTRGDGHDACARCERYGQRRLEAGAAHQAPPRPSDAPRRTPDTVAIVLSLVTARTV
jgi:hypothetical protein